MDVEQTIKELLELVKEYKASNKKHLNAKIRVLSEKDGYYIELETDTSFYLIPIPKNE